MSLVKYRAFLKVAETGSFSETAQQLHCTQSATSRMIHDLERFWNLKLFSRLKSGAVLTPEGKSLLPFIQNVVLADDDLKAAISSFGKLQSGTVRIGTFASVATVWLPRVVKAFKTKYPKVDYEILMGDFGEIERWVKSGRVDFGFTTPPTIEGLDQILVAEDELFLAVYSNHPFAEMDSVPAKLLENQPFFLLEKGKTSSVTSYLQQNHVTPSVELTTFEDYAIMNMVKMEFGIGILPELILQYPVDGVKLKHLDPKGHRKILLVMRQGGQLSLAAKEFLKCFGRELKAEITDSYQQAIGSYLNSSTQ